MENFSIVPRILDEVPPGNVEVEYEGGLKVENGTEIQPVSLKNAPSVSWDAEDDAFYTLALIDPDATENPQVRHWLVINIPGTNIDSGHIVSSYTGPHPPGNSGIHTYIFVVFKQSGLLVPQERADTQELRHGFNLREYAEKYNLGKPIAGNFLTAQADEYSLKFWEDKKKAEEQEQEFKQSGCCCSKK